MHNTPQCPKHPGHYLNQNKGCDALISLLPAPGWTAEGESFTNGDKISMPLVGWGLQCDETVQPWSIEPRSGEVMNARFIDDFDALAYNGSVVFTYPISD